MIIEITIIHCQYKDFSQILFIILIIIIYNIIKFLSVSDSAFTLTVHFRLFNGCKIQQNWLHCEISPNGRKSVMSRDNLFVHYLILVPGIPENCPGKLWDCTHVWNALIITHGFSTLPEMASHSNKHRSLHNYLPNYSYYAYHILKFQLLLN